MDSEKRRKVFLYKHCPRASCRRYRSIWKDDVDELWHVYKLLLLEIEQDITPMELTKGGLKPINPDERLTLTLCFLATGETYGSLSFQFRILRRANIVHSAGGLQSDY